VSNPIPVPASLVRHLKAGRCALFVGAGLSAGAGLPGWIQLLEILVNEVQSEDPSAATGPELRKLLGAGKLLEVADHCRQRLGERRYQELLGEQLRGGSGAVPLNHSIITQLPFSAIVTTNYDKLLERAYTLIRGDLPKVVTARDRESLGSLLFNGGFFILKAHGDIDDAESLVLTSRDYREIIHANPAFDALFSALLMTRSILFVGYSLADPDFRLLMDRQLSAFGENIPERYAVMADVGPVESDVLKRAANIKVLPYAAGQHAEVTAFLQALLQRVGSPAAAATPPAPAPAAGPAVSAPISPAPAIPRGVSIPPSPPGGGAPEVPAAPVPAVPVGMPGAVAAAEATLIITTRDDRLETMLRTGSEQVSHRSEPMSWSRFYRRLATLLEPGSTTARPADDYRRAGVRLAELLPSAALAALPADQVLAIDVGRDLANVPWELALCNGREPLAVALPLARTMTAQTPGARGLPGMRRPLRSLVIGDPGSDPAIRLQGAYEEAVAIADLYSDAFGDASCMLLCREEATLTAVVDALSSGAYDVIHFAGHAWFDAQESFLAFDRGEQVTAGELRSLLGPRPPGLLVLNSHYTAFLPRGMRPAELAGSRDVEMPATSDIGFTPMAIATGVGAFIGCFSSPADAPAKQFGVVLHRGFLEGQVLARAVQRARRETLSANVDDVSALQYVLAGHPHYQLA
jgi:hypothetical protein